MRRLLPSLLSCLVLLQLACFEKDPVTESVEITLFGDGTARIRTIVNVAAVPDEKEHAALLERGRAIRSTLELGHDDWSRRYQRLTANQERLTFRRSQGELMQVDRSAVVPQAEVARFFSDTSLSLQFVEGTDWSELLVYSSRKSNATAEQQRLVRDSLDHFVTLLARYYAATADLYAYVDRRPNRGSEIFRRLLEPQSDAELTEEEDVLLERMVSAASEIDNIRYVEEGRDYSLERASRLVYDSFPADLSFRVPAEIVEYNGFIAVESRLLRLPRVALLPAVASLNGVWVSPDLLGMVLDNELRGAPDTELSPSDFAAMPRRWSRPSPADVRAHLETSLTPPAQFRVRWKKPGPQEREEIEKLRAED